jgi:hypothetical protein
MSQIIYNAIRTPDGTVLHSRHRHDYLEHFDTVSGELYVNDGGNDYLRRSVNATPATELSVTMDAPHVVKRQVVTWKTYGKDGEFPEGKIVRLCDMETDHVRAILDTQYHIHGTYMEQIFSDELDYRMLEEQDIDATIQDILDAADFNKWFFTAKSTMREGFPLASELLFVYANNDDEKFAKLCDILEQCFNAGVKVGESK